MTQQDYSYDKQDRHCEYRDVGDTHAEDANDANQNNHGNTREAPQSGVGLSLLSRRWRTSLPVTPTVGAPSAYRSRTVEVVVVALMTRDVLDRTAC